MTEFTPTSPVSTRMTAFWQRFISFSTRYKVIAFPLFLFLLLVAGAYLVREIYTPQRSVTVVGIGTKKVKPARATVSFSLLVEGPTQQAVIAQGEEQFNRIITGISQFNPTEVARTAYQIAPGSSRTLQQISYQYVNAAKITTGNPSQIKQLIDYLYAQGATIVTQVRYVPENEKEVTTQLRELAVMDARTKVKEMAQAGGSRVGRLLAIQEGASTSQTGTPVTQANTTPSSELNELGEIELQTAVTVVFALW